MSELIRSVWRLRVEESTVLPRAYSLALAKRIHELLGISLGEDAIPTTHCSSLLGHSNLAGEFVTFSPTEPYTLMVCGLEQEAVQAITELDFAGGLELLGAKFMVEERLNELTSYEELYAIAIAEKPEPLKRISLRFRSPTAFAQNHTHLPLPVPQLMFRSWLERWNHFAPVYLGSDDLLAYLQSAVVLSQHRIQTQTFQIHRGYVNGFTGQITLQVLKQAEPLLANVAGLLFEYAQFAGTGMKTRLGMGVTEIVTKVPLTPP